MLETFNMFPLMLLVKQDQIILVTGSGTNLVDHGRFPLKVNGVANGGSNEQKNHCYNVDVVPEVPGFLGKHVNGENNRLTEMPYDDEEGSENGNEELNEKVSGDIKSNIQKVRSCLIFCSGLFII